MVKRKYLDTKRPIARKGKKQDTSDDLNWFLKIGLNAAKLIGLADNYKHADNDLHYRRNLYNVVDPVADYPRTIKEVLNYKTLADNARKLSVYYPKHRESSDSTADAAWAKRLGFPYNEKFLPSNPNGSVRLPSEVEAQIPVDTTFFKQRIEANKKLKKYYQDNYGGIPLDKREAIELGLATDEAALDSLRKTFATGKPVVMNEHAYIDRSWIDNGVTKLTLSPLNTLKDYTIQYDKDTNTMKYRDSYDFNWFEDFVPGNSFKIEGSVPVRSQQKKCLGGTIRRSLKYGGIHIKPSHHGRLTELKARTGKSEAELYNDGNPAHKKMVVFARNARKWH